MLKSFIEWVNEKDENDQRLYDDFANLSQEEFMAKYPTFTLDGYNHLGKEYNYFDGSTRNRNIFQAKSILQNQRGHGNVTVPGATDAGARRFTRKKVYHDRPYLAKQKPLTPKEDDDYWNAMYGR